MAAALALLLFMTATGTPEAQTKQTLKELSEEARFAILQRAQIWTPVTVGDESETRAQAGHIRAKRRRVVRPRRGETRRGAAKPSPTMAW
jgi:hypothetical protein